MKISISIPAYKRTYLKEAIDSCLAQTNQDFELIIVNDASPEDLDSIVNSYSDDRIRYYKNEKNCGAINVVDNWNKCLEYATGDYVICMGDDDRLLPNCLEEYARLIEKYPGLGVYHAWTEIIDEKGDPKKITVARPEYESVYSLIWHRMICRNQQFIGDFLFDITRLRSNGGFYKLPLAWGSDDISVVIAAKPNGIANTQTLTFQYRQNGETITSTGNSQIKVKALFQQKQWYDSFLLVQPTNTLDLIYYNEIRLSINHYYKKQIANVVANDFKSNILNIFVWIISGREVDRKTLLRAFFYYVLKLL